MKKITENIYVFEYETKIMPAVSFPVKSVLIELRDRELLIVSPGPFVESEIKGFVAKYKKVYCLAPNGFHHLHLGSFNKLFPEVDIFGPPIIKVKQKALASSIKSIESLKEHLSGQLSFYAIEGNELLSESVIHCNHSSSLIVTDLLFNMRAPMPLGRKILLKLVGAYDQPAQSRLIKASTKDKKSYLKSIDNLLKLKSEKLILAHGEDINDPIEIEMILRRLIK